MEYTRQKAEETTGKIVTGGLVEGVAIGGGFLVAGAGGKQVEKLVKKGVTRKSKLLDKVMAYGANNLPKGVAWYLLKKREMSEMKKAGRTSWPDPDNVAEVVIADVKKSMVGSIIFDTAYRAMNGFAPGEPVKLGNFQILGGDSSEVAVSQASNLKTLELQNNAQRVIQENSYLRGELNKALQKAAELTKSSEQLQQNMIAAQNSAQERLNAERQRMSVPAPVVHVTPVQPVVQQQVPVVQYQPAPVQAIQSPYEAEERRRRYGQMEGGAGDVTHNRQKEFGFMTEAEPPRVAQYAPPVVKDREKKFGFMGEKTKDIATMFGML